MIKKIDILIKKIRLFRILNSDGYLHDLGFVNSMLYKVPKNKNNEPIPWLTYPIIDFLVPRLNNKFNLLEYGAGYSTLYFSKYFNNILSIEHNKEWVDILKYKIPSNCKVIHSEDNKDDYVSNINIQSKFDVILIDGLFRNTCAINCLKYLRSNGVIIFDDSNRLDYDQGFSYLLDKKFKRLDFWGLSPGSHRNNCTTIFYLENNCLGI